MAIRECIARIVPFMVVRIRQPITTIPGLIAIMVPVPIVRPVLCGHRPIIPVYVTLRDMSSINGSGAPVATARRMRKTVMVTDGPVGALAILLRIVSMRLALVHTVVSPLPFPNITMQIVIASGRKPDMAG